VIGLRLRLQLGNRFCITLSVFPNLEHGWDARRTRPGEGGGLSTTLWTSRGQSTDKRPATGDMGRSVRER
jgi:hypothetical protein